MNANELRIGNYVFTKDKHLILFTSFFGLCNAEVSPDKFEPIPLTEEWLVEFGFKKERRKKVSPKHGSFFSRNIWDYKYSFAYAKFRDDWGFYNSYTDAPDPKDNNKFDFISCGTKYVHQLQNLYFALTGEELTLKSEL